MYVALRQAARLDDENVKSNFYLVGFRPHLYLTTVFRFCLLVKLNKIQIFQTEKVGAVKGFTAPLFASGWMKARVNA